MRQNGSKFMIGLVITAIGLYIILSAAGIELPVFFDGWWTLPIIIIGVVSMANNGLNGGNLAMVAVGSWLLANQRGWIPHWFNGGYVAGAAVLLFGILFLSNSNSRSHKPSDDASDRDRYSRRPHSDAGTYAKQHGQSGDEAAYNTRRSSERANRSWQGQGNAHRGDSDPNPSYTAVFSGQDVRNVSSNLDSCTLFALFGGLTVDFRDAVIDHDLVIDASALFGGIDLRFPDSVRVETRATPIFGGVDNRSRDNDDPDAPVVTVRCLAAFGGIDIK